MNGLNNVSLLQQGNQLLGAQQNAALKMAKISSGLKINKAADDAAGMAIAMKLLGQARGTRQAERNIEDGLSLIQTADGGLSQVDSQLQRMRELSIQASNDTLSADNRALLQQEINALKQGINDIANNTEFNGIHLLNAGGGTGATYEATTSVIDLSQITGVTIFEVSGSNPNPLYFSLQDLTSGNATYSVGLESYEFSIDLTNNTITSKALYAPFVDINNQGLVPLNNIYGVRLEGVSGYDNSQVWATDIDWTQTTPGGSAENTLGPITSASSGYGVTPTYDTYITWNFQARKELTPGTGISTGPQGLIIHTGPNTDQNVEIPLSDVRTANLGIDASEVTTQSAANSTIADIDAALNYVSGEQGRWGSYQNRLEHTYYNALNSELNLTSAESRVRDAVLAKEISGLAAQNILLDVSASMMSHTFAARKNVLALLD